MLRRRGAAEAGAIFVKIDRLDGMAALYGPAPQTETAARGVDRLWTRMHKDAWIPTLDVEERLAKELRFDPDLWIIEVEDRQGRVFLDLAGGEPSYRRSRKFLRSGALDSTAAISAPMSAGRLGVCAAVGS